MWGHKRRRIADLEVEVRELRAEARRNRQDTERTHGFVRQRLATSATTAHDEADRYRTAWQSAAAGRRRPRPARPARARDDEGGDRAVSAAQIQLSAVVEGTVDAAAGERAKARGMAQAAAGTAPNWATACDAAIRVLAARGTEFQAADLIAEGLVDEPALPAQWGPRFQAAARAGVIEPCGYARSKRATVRASVCRTWRGRGAA